MKNTNKINIKSKKERAKDLTKYLINTPGFEKTFVKATEIKSGTEASKKGLKEARKLWKKKK